MSESRFCSKCGAELQPGTAFCPKCGAPVGQASGPTGAPVSGIDALIKDPGVQSYWIRRFFALVIDVIVIIIILAVIAVFAVIPAFVLSGTAGVVSFFVGVFSIAAGVIVFFYFVVAEVTRGATFGKHLLHLKVIGPNGGNPNLIESLVRNVSKIYWLLLLLDVIVGLATSKQYTQKFSDKIVGTSVVRWALGTSSEVIGVEETEPGDQRSLDFSKPGQSENVRSNGGGFPPHSRAAVRSV